MMIKKKRITVMSKFIIKFIDNHKYYKWEYGFKRLDVNVDKLIAHFE